MAMALEWATKKYDLVVVWTKGLQAVEISVRMELHMDSNDLVSVSLGLKSLVKQV